MQYLAFSAILYCNKKRRLFKLHCDTGDRNESVNMTIHPEPHFKIIGHRGASALAPENTLISFALAAQQGLNWVEFDTLRLDSGEWVVIHDNTLERTSTGTGSVVDKSVHYLKRLDAGSWFSHQYRNERIPLLAETLDFLLTLGLQANIEIKTMNGNPMLLMQSFLNYLNKYWPQTAIPPLVSSFDLQLLIALQSIQKKRYPLGYIIKKFTPEALETAIQYEFTTINCDYRYIQPNDIANIRAHHIAVLLYTINEPTIARQVLRQGATAIFSNYPDLLKEH